MNAAKTKNRKLDIALVAVVILAACYGGMQYFSDNADATEQNDTERPAFQDSGSADTVMMSNGGSSQSNSHSQVQKEVRKQAAERLVADMKDELEKAKAENALSDEAFMAALRKLRVEDPSAALEMADRGEIRFEGTPLAAECAWQGVRALVDLGDNEKAKEKTREMMDLYPQSRWTMDARRHMFYGPENRE